MQGPVYFRYSPSPLYRTFQAVTCFYTSSLRQDAAPPVCARRAGRVLDGVWLAAPAHLAVPLHALEQPDVQGPLAVPVRRARRGRQQGVVRLHPPAGGRWERVAFQLERRRCRWDEAQLARCNRRADEREQEADPGQGGWIRCQLVRDPALRLSCQISPSDGTSHPFDTRQAHFYAIDLPVSQAGAANENVTVTINEVYVHASVPKPAEVVQDAMSQGMYWAADLLGGAGALSQPISKATVRVKCVLHV